MRIAIVALLMLAACKNGYTLADNPADAGTPVPASDGGTTPITTTPDAGTLPGTVTPTAAVGCPAAAHSCVPDAPSGWNGPLFLYDGDDGQVPDCPSAMNIARVDAHRGFHDPPASTCSNCSCNVPFGATCTFTLNTGDASCASLPNQSAFGQQACTRIDPNVGYGLTTTAVGGSCLPFGGFPELADIPWDAAVRACGADGLLRTGCDDGLICAPDPPTPFNAKLCVMKAGDVDCPGAPFTTKTLTNDVDDTRDCTKGCTCGDPTGSSCFGAETFVYNGSTTCSGVVPDVDALPTMSCQKSGASGASIRAVAAVASGGTCGAKGVATPTGTVTVGAPTTVCCQD